MKFILIIVFTLFTISCGSAQNQLNINNQSSSEIVSPPSIPKEISFAGERVPLNEQSIAEDLLCEVIITKYMHSRTLKALLSSKQYFPIIEPILKKNGIPDDFKYLCVAESNLEPNAYSPAEAAGLWQIIPTTAKENKLEVNKFIDERYNIEKSTDVACKYFNAAYKRFGNWTMAAAAYNVGMAGLDRRSNTQQQTNFYNLFLPSETMRYIFRILSYKILFESPDHLSFDIKENDYFAPRKYKNISVSSHVIDWVEFAKQHNTNYKNLRKLNPWIRDYKYTNKLGKNYTVKIPN